MLTPGLRVQLGEVRKKAMGYAMVKSSIREAMFDASVLMSETACAKVLYAYYAFLLNVGESIVFTETEISELRKELKDSQYVQLLSVMYRHGWGVKKDVAQADYLKCVTLNGERRGAENLVARILRELEQPDKKMLEKLVNELERSENDLYGMRLDCLAYCYHFGCGVEIDHDKAHNFAMQATNIIDAPVSFYVLGRIALMDNDKALAVEFFKQSMERKYGPAFAALGYAAKRRGDVDEARSLYTEGVRLGCAEAQEYLKELDQQAAQQSVVSGLLPIFTVLQATAGRRCLVGDGVLVSAAALSTQEALMGSASDPSDSGDSRYVFSVV
jgi:TPR repeat protein